MGRETATPTEKPLISVIVPVHNAENTLDETIRSLLNQTFGFENIEVILVENGSSDASVQIIQKYAHLHDNIVLMQQDTPCGPGKARNLGLERVRADFVMFLDADDLFTKDACSLLYTTATEGNYDFVSGAYSIIDGKGETTLAIGPGYGGRPQTEFALPKEMKAHLAAVRDAFWCKIYRKSIIQENSIRFLEQGAAEDLFFLYSYLFACKTSLYIPHIVLLYRVTGVDDDSVAQGVSKEHFFYVADNYAQIYHLFKAHEEEASFKVITEGILDYHLGRVIRSSVLADWDRAEILKRWKWLFAWQKEENIPWGAYSGMIYREVLGDEMESAADLLARMAPANDTIHELNELMVRNANELNAFAKREAVAAQEIAELNSRIHNLAEENALLEKRLATLSGRSKTSSDQITELNDHTSKLVEQNRQLKHRLEAIENSRSWRLAIKLQAVVNKFQGKGK